MVPITEKAGSKTLWFLLPALSVIGTIMPLIFPPCKIHRRQESFVSRMTSDWNKLHQPIVLSH
jgi:hypothetical protein